MPSAAVSPAKPSIGAREPASLGDLVPALPRSSPRLVLRPFRESDYADVHAYASDEEVTRFLRWGPNDPTETLRFLRRAIRSARGPDAERLDLAVVECASRRVCGGLGLFRREARRIEIGYCFARRVWGRGYATEAVASAVALVEGWAGSESQPGAVEVFALVSPGNPASERVLERSGFERASDPGPYEVWMDGRCAAASVWRRRTAR